MTHVFLVIVLGFVFTTVFLFSQTPSRRAIPQRRDALGGNNGGLGLMTALFGGFVVLLILSTHH
jgi:hypothetical protein